MYIIFFQQSDDQSANEGKQDKQKTTYDQLVDLFPDEDTEDRGSKFDYLFNMC